MSRYFYYDDSGRVLSESVDRQPAREGVHELLCDAPAGAGFSHYAQGGTLHSKGDRPAASHTFSYTTKQWVANPAAAWAAVKLARQKLLTESDWRVTKAAESGQPVPPEWVTYRQALRDITSQADPLALDWPVAP